MNITKAKLEALDYYLSFGAQDLSGNHDFEISTHSDRDEPVTWINETDFTRKEYKKLEKGAEVFEYMQKILANQGYTITEQEE